MQSPPFPVTSSFPGPNILLNTMFSSQTPSASFPPAMSTTKFHTHTKQQAKLTCALYNGKFHPRKCREGTDREESYNPTLSLTSALDVCGFSSPRPARFTPGNESRYVMYSRLRGPQGRYGRERKVSSNTARCFRRFVYFVYDSGGK